MWADTDTSTDYINYTETAEIAADLIRQPAMLPLSLGVFGGWGAGKSSMLQLIKKEIEKDEQHIIINFDAWLFQNYDDARASLMEVISRQLIKSAEENKDLFDKAKGLLKRVNYLRAIGTTVEIGASLALGIPPLGFFKRGIDAVGDILSDKGDIEVSFQEVKGAAKEGANFAKSFVNNEENTPPQQITAFRKHFAEVLHGLDKTLVIFIDNLDRCLPNVAIETLEAIRLFLFLDNTAFIIAADEEMIRGSVRSHYDGIDEKHITDYLDKLIQVPMRVPLLGVPEVQSYTSLLFTAADQEGVKLLDQVREYSCDQIMNSWNNAKLEASKIISNFDIQSATLKSSLDLAERLAPILTSAPNISGNPRIIKRLLNTIRMRCKLAERRKMPVDEALLTKFAIFERCTSDTSYEYLAKVILDAETGQPELISKLEELLEDQEAFTDELPTLWKDKDSFIYKWFKLEPALSGRDLRPAVYLSKESARLTSINNGLSPHAKKLFQELLTLTRAVSKSAKDLILSTPEIEQIETMKALIRELRKATDWKKAPAGFHGAVLLSNHAPKLGEQLILFLNEKPAASIGSWAMPLIAKQIWAKDMVEHWKSTGKNPIKSMKRAR